MIYRALPKIFLFCFFLLWASANTAFAQKKIEILRTDSLVFEKRRGADLRRLYGNVKFKHNDVIMYCDSAHFYSKDNLFNAYSRVNIDQKNELFIIADSLIYNGNNQFAKLRGRVKMTDDGTTLVTKFLDYDLENHIGYYYNGGTITDAENVLVSESGTYRETEKEMLFKDSVTLTNPEYIIYTDTLRYLTSPEIAFFYGPTDIVSDENFIYTENGWYDTKKNEAQFEKNSYMQNKSNFIYGDSLYYDRNKGYGKAFDNVLIKDTTEGLLIYGEYAYYKEEPEFFFVKDSLCLIKTFSSDSLYLHADSLTMASFLADTLSSDTTTYRLIKAFHKVRFFKPDLQGCADSIVYNTKDSIIQLLINPIIWTENNQITGEKIRIHLLKNEVDKIYVDENSLLVQQDDSVSYNQIKGSNMISYLREQEMYRLDVNGKGETIYYLRDGESLTGINKAICEDITVFFKDSEVETITFKKKPSGTLFPPDKLSSEESRLEGFKWNSYQRPIDKNDIYIYR
ncbi:MAG: hypothetical protein IPO21_08255 [Bacteroidales bacterium]|nr:hypothetical protein [Bacteroidales bacterium]